MKAILWTGYGPPDVLALGELPRPVPGPGEVLVKVMATTVTAGDIEMRSLQIPPWLRLPTRLYVGWSRPSRIRVLGQELAGVVQAVGEGVNRLKVGDSVFGATGPTLGAYAEHVCLPVDSDVAALALKPDNLTFEQAAAIPVGGLEALGFLKQANIQPGQRVLICGAGGSIGTIAVQLVKHWGGRVTAVDSAEKLDMLHDIGAEHTIDYRQSDWTQDGVTYDVVLDVVGKSPYGASLRSLSKTGVLLVANPSLRSMLRGRWTTSTTEQTVITQTQGQRLDDLLRLKQLAEEEKIRPVIDRCFGLAQMTDAHAYVETGQKQGSVVVTVADAPAATARSSATPPPPPA